MKSLIFLFIFTVASVYGFAQDAVNTLSYDDFITQVIKHHPTAYRASIVEKLGETQVKEARGAFDPKLFGNVDQKYFDEKQYYSHIQGGLKIPTWFGLSAETGYQLSDGLYLNPEQQLPNDGLWYAGLRLELGNGLIIDQRRAALKKAKLYKLSSQLERRVVLNQLRLDASVAYWKWKQAYDELTIYQLAKNNAALRLEAVKNAAAFGERPQIDTVEAFITVQRRNMDVLNAENALENARFNLELYLWADGFIPLELGNTVPDSNNNSNNAIASLSEMDSLITNHPYLQINRLQLEEKKVELLLKKEQLKPQLTLKYNALSEPVAGGVWANYATENYKWGATLAYPIFTRKERGSLQLAKLKLEDQQLKNKINAVDVQYKFKTSMNNYMLSLEQLKTMELLVRSNQSLYEAEQNLFNLGESSVFMINARESAWLNYQVQWIASQTQNNILKAGLEFQIMNLE